MNGKNKHYTTSLKLAMKAVMVCVLFEYKRVACNSTELAVNIAVISRQKTIGVFQVVALVGLPLT